MITELTNVHDQLDQCRGLTGGLVGDNMSISLSPAAKAALVFAPSNR
jgi:hypothetical protein